MIIKRLNENGISRFSDFLDSLTTDSPMLYPALLLSDPDATEEITPSIEIEKRKFDNRLELAEYFFNLFHTYGLANVETDRGLWAWLALFYFEDLYPKNASGDRGEIARYLPELGSAWRYYRHLLAGPFLIYKSHCDDPERVGLLLCGSIKNPGEIVGQLAANTKIITNKGVLEAANILYYDNAGRKIKKGARSKIKGAARRFAVLMSQFDLTWDLGSLQATDVIKMLPDEYSRFLKKRSK